MAGHGGESGMQTASHEACLELPALRKSSDDAIVDQGRIIAASKIARDMSERQRIHRDLRQREALLRSILDTVPDALIVIDKQGLVQSFSAAAERLFGFNAGEVTGQNISMLMPSPYREAHDHYLAHYLATGERHVIGMERIVVGLRKDGTTFPMQLTVGEVSLPGIQLFTGFVRDLTERRLVEEKLRQSQKMHALGHLTGGVAHDFNNLLTVIMGNLELLGRSLQAGGAARSEARVTRSIASAMEGARRAAMLTQRLLAFSRLQSLQPRTLEPNRLVSRAVDMLRRTLGEQVIIETRLAAGVGCVSADPVELDSAILNLAVNARDAMPAGGTVVIETANVDCLDDDTGVPYVLIAVRDNGVGMDSETAAKAFEPFFTTKQTGRGTGLGLSQVHGFVHQSGGQVRIDSRPGVGTTVQIYLPRLPDYAEEDEPALGMPEGDVQRGTETILVVEDDDEVRASCTEVLRELGYRVLEAPNASAALEILDRQPDVRLLFTDIGLPGAMSGRQLTDEARHRRSSLKMLLTTGYARDSIVHGDGLQSGVALITKPFSYASLARKVREALDA